MSENHNMLSRYDDCNYTTQYGTVTADVFKIRNVYRQCQTEKLQLDAATASFIIKELAKYHTRARRRNQLREFLEEVYRESKSLKLVLNQRSLNCILDMYGNSREYNNMFAIFEDMKKMGLVDQVSMSCLIKNTSRRSLTEMMEYYHLMVEMNFKPCEKIFGTMAVGLYLRLKDADYEPVLKAVLSELANSDVPPDRTIDILLCGLHRNGSQEDVQFATEEVKKLFSPTTETQKLLPQEVNSQVWVIL